MQFIESLNVSAPSNNATTCKNIRRVKKKAWSLGCDSFVVATETIFNFKLQMVSIIFPTIVRK